MRAVQIESTGETADHARIHGGSVSLQLQTGKKKVYVSLGQSI